MESPKAEDLSRREWLAVAALTAIGLALRSWPIGRLGLSHFDEGIYALVASWSLLPKGLAGIDPSLIPYAPPGYPILGGLAYWVLGRSDGAMIAVSQVAGTLTIPVVAWLGRRTFGPGAGFASATFCTFSGPHIAFSRMALTDASFLLAWLLALGAGMRFLERPGALRAVVMGLAVGLAQEFKYNGWLTGGIVVASAAWGIVIRPEERRVGSILRTFGWGVLGAGIACLVVWPWYAFVEAHGGYSALLRHQQSYLGGWRDWEPNFFIQAEQAVAMRELGVVGVSVFLVCLTSWIARPPFLNDVTKHLSPARRAFASVPFGLCTLPYILAPYILGLMMAPWLLSWRRASVRLLGVWWLILSLITPFYHPYARLWLPYHAVNWLLLGWWVTHGFAVYVNELKDVRDQSFGKEYLLRSLRQATVGVLYFIGLAVLLLTFKRQAFPQPGLLAPSDSLYRACVRVAERLPEDVREVRLMARPPVTFYLGTRVALKRFADLDQLLQRSDPLTWALVNSAVLNSEQGEASDVSSRNLLDRFAKNWEVVEEIPTTPNLPTLLDLDPSMARSANGDRAYPLWLLRPRTSKATQ